MAKSTSGKMVSRVAASGGGKRHGKVRSSNFTGIIILIVILGTLLTVYSRYEYQNPVTTTTAPQVAPTIGTTWYAALSIQACGSNLPYLKTDPTFKGGFTVLPDDVIQVAPNSAIDAGNNATVKQFGAEYPGLIVSSNEIAVPNAKGAQSKATTYRNGDVCAKGTKYAGQKGQVSYAYWSSFGQKSPTIVLDPSKIKFTQQMRITMAFEPKGVTPRAPTKASVNAMVTAIQIAATTTTTSAPTSTLAPTTTTTSSTGSSTTTSSTSSSTTTPKG